jgi:F0F1-type ATP synthase epsilon subunit
MRIAGVNGEMGILEVHEKAVKCIDCKKLT